MKIPGNGAKPLSKLEALRQAQTFDKTHELWGAQITWGRGETLGGHNDKWAFVVEPEPNGKGEPTLVVGPHRDGVMDRDKAQRREMTPADVGALMTVLASSLDRMEQKRADAGGSAVSAADVQALEAQIAQLGKLRLPEEMAAHVDRAVGALKSALVAIHPPSDFERATGALFDSVTQPATWSSTPGSHKPVEESKLQEGKSLLALRLSGKL